MKSSKNNKTRRKKGSKRPSWLRRPIILCAAAIVICAVVGVGFWFSNVCRMKYNGEKVRIYIPKDATAQSICDTLRLRLGEDFGSKVYDIWSWRNGVPATAKGSYVIETGDVALDVSRRLLSGAQNPVRVTFNNARTMDQLAAKVSKNMDFDADDFLAACDTVLPAMGFDKANFPAAFLPDTYEFYWSAEPDYVVKRLVDVRNKFWNKERTSLAQAMGMTPEQVAVVASIVEEETIKSDERPKVARLYLNRLDKGMKLQADPTVKFALGDFSLRRITNKHLEVNSPYNTYMVTGLPPGPIRIVESKTLDDVLYAPSHNYIYMCAKEDFSGYHNFAVTAEQHMANARRYHAALNARNIR